MDYDEFASFAGGSWEHEIESLRQQLANANDELATMRYLKQRKPKSECLAAIKERDELRQQLAECQKALSGVVDTERNACADEIERKSKEEYAVVLCEHEEAANWLRSNTQINEHITEMIGASVECRVGHQ